MTQLAASALCRRKPSAAQRRGGRLAKARVPDAVGSQLLRGDRPNHCGCAPPSFFSICAGLGWDCWEGQTWGRSGLGPRDLLRGLRQGFGERDR